MPAAAANESLSKARQRAIAAATGAVATTAYSNTKHNWLSQTSVDALFTSSHLSGWSQPDARRRRDRKPFGGDTEELSPPPLVLSPPPFKHKAKLVVTNIGGKCTSHHHLTCQGGPTQRLAAAATESLSEVIQKSCRRRRRCCRHHLSRSMHQMAADPLGSIGSCPRRLFGQHPIGP